MCLNNPQKLERKDRDYGSMNYHKKRKDASQPSIRGEDSCIIRTMRMLLGARGKGGKVN